MTLEEFFTKIADAIREKKNTQDKIPALNFPDEISSITTGGGSSSEEGYVQTNFYQLLLDGNYGYFPPEVCEQLINGTYSLEEV